jgi:hypothetical protein
MNDIEDAGIKGEHYTVVSTLEQYNRLPQDQKRLIKLYMQLPIEEIEKKMEQFMDQASESTNSSLSDEFNKQVVLYSSARILKENNVRIAGKRKTRKVKRKATRRRRYH